MFSVQRGMVMSSAPTHGSQDTREGEACQSSHLDCHSAYHCRDFGNRGCFFLVRQGTALSYSMVADTLFENPRVNRSASIATFETSAESPHGRNTLSL